MRHWLGATTPTGRAARAASNDLLRAKREDSYMVIFIARVVQRRGSHWRALSLCRGAQRRPWPGLAPPLALSDRGDALARGLKTQDAAPTLPCSRARAREMVAARTLARERETQTVMIGAGCRHSVGDRFALSATVLFSYPSRHWERRTPRPDGSRSTRRGDRARCRSYSSARGVQRHGPRWRALRLGSWAQITVSLTYAALLCASVAGCSRASSSRAPGWRAARSLGEVRVEFAAH